MRLNQYIAACGLCSRREADRLIREGQVLVDGIPASLGMSLEGGEKVTVKGRVLSSRAEPVVVAWYKPVGVTCTERDPHAGKVIGDVFRFPVRLTYAGRLDRDSEGLLLMTNDGPLIDAMMRAANGHEKEYIVRVKRRISDAELHRLETGIFLKELEKKTRPCRVERLGERTFRIILTQGLNRQIRRMCRTLGHDVVFLKRVRVLNIQLGSLKPGQQRRIEGEELEELYDLSGCRVPVQEQPGSRSPQRKEKAQNTVCGIISGIWAVIRIAMVVWFFLNITVLY